MLFLARSTSLGPDSQSPKRNRQTPTQGSTGQVGGWKIHLEGERRPRPSKKIEEKNFIYKHVPEKAHFKNLSKSYYS